MTAPTRSTATIFASASIAAGGTKIAPATGGTGGWVDVRSYNGGHIGWSVKNGASAPTVPGQFTFQVSDDGTNNITDLWSGGGDNVANSEQTGLVDLPATASYVRMLCYGNTVNSVTFKSVFFAKG